MRTRGRDVALALVALIVVAAVGFFVWKRWHRARPLTE
jgi:hypothetical protein